MVKINNKWIGYCTNVHAGFDLEVTQKNLNEHALQVKQQCAPESEMGIGLWLSDQSAIDMISQDKVQRFGEWLHDAGLVPFTFNGFPYGNFHQDEVKKLVYLPTWADDARREYSERLAQIQNELLPRGMEGSISTLPLAWNDDKVDDGFLTDCAGQLIELAEFLAELEEKSNRLIYFCIEPEPGCVMQTSQTCLDFFEKYLLGKSNQVDQLVARYLRICHDVCHSAVMFEDQAEFIQNIYAAGLQIGKVQISSAVRAEFSGDVEKKKNALRQLTQFREPRYLHQTVLKDQQGATHFFEDLPPALEALEQNLDQYHEARVHFHVPIFLKEFGHLKSTQTDILQCLEATQAIDGLNHFEAETYAWDVLPDELRQEKLADGIAEEIKWLTNLNQS